MEFAHFSLTSPPADARLKAVEDKLLQKLELSYHRTFSPAGTLAEQALQGTFTHRFAYMISTWFPYLTHARAVEIIQQSRFLREVIEAIASAAPPTA